MTAVDIWQIAAGALVAYVSVPPLRRFWDSSYSAILSAIALGYVTEIAAGLVVRLMTTNG